MGDEEHQAMDAEVATTIMGWRLGQNATWRAADDSWTGWVSEPTEDCDVWSPSTDICAAYEMEEEIEQRGLAEAYVRALIDITTGNLMRHDLRGLYEDDMWKVAHASPAQRCRAALAAAGMIAKEDARK